MESNKHPVLVISRSTPPRTGGTPSILANQFSWLENDFIFVGSRPNVNETRNVMKNNWFFYDIPQIKSNRFLPGFEFLLVFRIVYTSLKAIKKHDCKSVILLLLDEPYILSGYLVAKITKLPLTFYVQDLYSDSNIINGFLRKKFAKFLEKLLINLSKYHITNIPPLVDYYNSKWKINMKLVTNCFPKNISIENNHKIMFPKKGKDKIIGFCGSLYWANSDNFKILVKALSGLTNFRLVIFGSQSIKSIKNLGIDTKKVSQKFIPDIAELQNSLMKCDILFMPFTFNLKYKMFMLNAFPTKIHNYLFSSRPILAHCPSESYITRFFKKNSGALIVNDNSEIKLREGIIKIINDKSLQKDLIKNIEKISYEYRYDRPVEYLNEILSDF